MSAIAVGSASEDKALGLVAERLGKQFNLAPEVIEAAITSSLANYTGRPIRDFVPVLVEREARERLRSAVTIQQPV